MDNCQFSSPFDSGRLASTSIDRTIPEHLVGRSVSLRPAKNRVLPCGCQEFVQGGALLLTRRSGTLYRTRFSIPTFNAKRREISRLYNVPAGDFQPCYYTSLPYPLLCENLKIISLILNTLNTKNTQYSILKTLNTQYQKHSILNTKNTQYSIPKTPNTQYQKHSILNTKNTQYSILKIPNTKIPTYNIPPSSQSSTVTRLTSTRSPVISRRILYSCKRA